MHFFSDPYCFTGPVSLLEAHCAACEQTPGALDPAHCQTDHEDEIDIVAAVNQSFVLEVLESLMIAKNSELAARST